MLFADQNSIDSLADSPWSSDKVWGLVRASFWFALVFFVLAVAVYVVRKLQHRKEAESSGDSSELITEFRDLHARGGLSDDEYKTIKTKLSAELRDELRDSGQSH